MPYSNCVAPFAYDAPENEPTRERSWKTALCHRGVRRDPLSNSNYFAFFDLLPKLQIDTVSLEQRFYSLSRRLHPDRFASKPAAEQEAALSQSSLLNDAYRTLKDPILRTQYLLTLEGVELEEQSKAATDAARASGEQKKQIVPPELLEEVFELNMQLAEMRAAREMGEDEPELRRDLLTAKDAFDAKMVETQADLEELWTVWDVGVDAGDEAAKTRAKEAMVELLNKRSYLRNLVRDVNEALGL
jgi:molecular chaperone HscB